MNLVICYSKDLQQEKERSSKKAAIEKVCFIG